MRCAIHYILFAYWIILLIRVLSSWFRPPAFRGYHEQDVDDFLDEVTEELTHLLDEIRQLRDGAGMPAFPAGGEAGTSDALRTADDIVRQAREEAAEILRRARAEAAGSAGGAGGSLQPFLAQERTFLQELSRLIQGHADTVRDMARSRARAGRSPGPGDAP